MSAELLLLLGTFLDKEIQHFILSYIDAILPKMQFHLAAPPTAQLKELMKKVLAGPETNVSLVCLVTGHPKPNINWTM